jgi:hypothetical protein
MQELSIADLIAISEKLKKLKKKFEALEEGMTIPVIYNTWRRNPEIGTVLMRIVDAKDNHVSIDLFHKLYFSHDLVGDPEFEPFEYVNDRISFYLENNNAGFVGNLDASQIENVLSQALRNEPVKIEFVRVSYNGNSNCFNYVTKIETK